MRFKLLAALVFVVLPMSMVAETINFNLLDSNGTTIDGTGSLVLISPAVNETLGPSSGEVSGDISSLTVDITSPFTQTFSFVPGFVVASFNSMGDLTGLEDFAINSSTEQSVTLTSSGGTPDLTFLIGTSYSNPDAASGTIVPMNVAPTPEPSSLLLLGTGLVSVAGFARRKIGWA